MLLDDELDYNEFQKNSQQEGQISIEKHKAKARRFLGQRQSGPRSEGGEEERKQEEREGGGEEGRREEEKGALSARAASTQIEDLLEETFYVRSLHSSRIFCH